MKMPLPLRSFAVIADIEDGLEESIGKFLMRAASLIRTFSQFGSGQPELLNHIVELANL